MRDIPVWVGHPSWPIVKNTGTTYDEIIQERFRAHQKHDKNGHSMERTDYNDPRWLPVVVEEIGEVAKAICESGSALSPQAATKELREELIQVLAMCSAWVDAIDMHIWKPKESND